MTQSDFLQKYWQRFSRNKMSLWSLRIWLGLFSLCLLAPLIAHENPLCIWYKRALFFPSISYYPETAFGQKYDLEPDYRSAEVKHIIQDAGGYMLWSIFPYGPETVDEQLETPPSAPTWPHFLGTDEQGRDVFVRLLYGVRAALCFGLSLAFFSGLIAVVIGGIQGYCGGWVDLSMQRVVEIWGALPVMFLMMVLSSLIEPTVGMFLLLMSLFQWTALAPFVRAEFLRARTYPYVLAAQSMGQRRIVIIFRHIFPNAMVSPLAVFPFVISESIVSLTALDFLGFGMPPEMACLGEMLRQSKDNLSAPWIGISSFCALAVILLLITFIGEGVRDAADTQDLGAT